MSNISVNFLRFVANKDLFPPNASNKDKRMFSGSESLVDCSFAQSDLMLQVPGEGIDHGVWCWGGETNNMDYTRREALRKMKKV